MQIYIYTSRMQASGERRRVYIGGRGFVCEIIEPVTFARCAFIIALWNIALGGYLDTRRNILEHLQHDVQPETYRITANFRWCKFSLKP